MNNIHDRVREVLWQRSRDVPPHLEVPGTLTRRVRRRIALNGLVVGTTVVVAVVGVLVGMRTFGSSRIRPPFPTGGNPQACTAAQLEATAALEGAPGSREGSFVVTNRSGEACTVTGTPKIELIDPSLGPITSGVTFESGAPMWKKDGLPEPEGWPVVTIDPGRAASIQIRWSNWCPDGRGVPTWRVDVGDGAVDVDGMQDVYPPPCNGEGMPSTIEVGPFEPA
jgi:hypothetical protein